MPDRFKEFIAEGEELIEGLNQHLTQLGTCFSLSVPPKPDVINGIFRNMHTLKGISSVLGLDKISSVSHSLENLLDKIRMGEVPLSSQLLEVLLEGVEVLRRLVERVRCGSEETPGEISDDAGIPSLMGAIARHCEGETRERETTTVRSSIDPSIVKLLTDYEVHRLQESLEEGDVIFRVRVRFQLQKFDEDLTVLQEKISECGEIIAILPVSGASEETGIEFLLVVAAPRGVLEKIPGIGVEEISMDKTGGAPLIQKPDSLPHIPPPSPSDPLPSTSLTTGPIATAFDRTSGGGENHAGTTPQRSVRSLSQTVRVDIPKLDDLLNVVGEMVMTHGQLAQLARELKGYTDNRWLAMEAQKATLDLHRKLTFLREGMIDIRMVPISQIFDRLVRAGQKISRETGKDIDMRVWGGETRMDKAMMEEIVDPLMHLVRNAVDHGIEPEAKRIRADKPRIGMITLSASQRGNSVVIEVEDDGGGLDLQRIQEKGVEDELIQPGVRMEEKDLTKLIFKPGFSTRNHVDKISGRGVGLDVVARNVTHLRGMINVFTTPGKGTKFQVTLPLTLLIIKALIVSVEGRQYAIPINSVAESLFLPHQDIKTIENREMIHLRGQTLPLVRLKEIFMLQPRHPSSSGEETDPPLLANHPEDVQDKVYVVIVGVAEKRMGIVVDQILEQQEIVIKSLGEGLGHVPGIAGATELGNRKTILVLDVGALIEEIFLYSRAHVADLK